MSDKGFYCKECCRDISEEDLHNYNGYCKSCYIELDNKKQNSNTDNTLYINNVAHNIKLISVITCIISIVFGLIMWADTEEAIIPIIIIVISIIVAIFIYGFGEIIQLLEDIKNK